MNIFFSHFLCWWSVIMWGVSWCTCDWSSRTGGKTIITIVLLYYYMIRRAVNIMSVAEKTCIKVDTFWSTISPVIASQVSYPLPSPSPQGYSGTSPLRDPYPRNSSFQETQNLVHNQDTSLFWVKGHFSASQNPGLTSIQGTPWLLRGSSPQKGLMSLSVH